MAAVDGSLVFATMGQLLAVLVLLRASVAQAGTRPVLDTIVLGAAQGALAGDRSCRVLLVEKIPVAATFSDHFKNVA